MSEDGSHGLCKTYQDLLLECLSNSMNLGTDKILEHKNEVTALKAEIEHLKIKQDRIVEANRILVDMLELQLAQKEEELNDRSTCTNEPCEHKVLLEQLRLEHDDLVAMKPMLKAIVTDHEERTEEDEEDEERERSIWTDDDAGSRSDNDCDYSEESAINTSLLCWEGVCHICDSQWKAARLRKSQTDTPRSSPVSQSESVPQKSELTWAQVVKQGSKTRCTVNDSSMGFCTVVGCGCWKSTWHLPPPRSDLGWSSPEGCAVWKWAEAFCGNVAPEDAQAELTPTILDLAPVEHRPSSQPLTRHMDFTGNDDSSAKEAAVGTLKDETRTVTPTRRSYGAITGNGETRIHAGDHIGAYNDLRTTVSTACQEQSSWTRIGADVVSRVLASIVLSSFHFRWSPKPARSSDTCAQPVISDTVAATDRHVTPKGYQATEAPNIMTKTTESNLATEESASWVAQYTNFFAALGDAPCPIEDAGFSRRLHSGQAQPLTIRQRDKPHDAGHHLKPLRRAPAQDYAGPDSSVRETRSTATNSAALAQRLNNANNDSALTAEVPTALRAHDDSLVPHAEKIAGEQSLTGAYVPPPSGQYFNEKLGEDFRLYPGEHSRTLFRPGSVIAVFWHDNCGRSLTAPPADRSYQQSCISTIKGEKVYSHIRRFVIVQRRSKFMIGLPISTYSGKRLTDSERMAHATFYNLGGERRRLSDEQRFIKPTICVDLSVSGQTLSYNSRINYAKPYSIDHNIKIKYLGSVIDEDLRALLLSFRAEMFPSGDDEDSDTTVDS